MPLLQPDVRRIAPRVSEPAPDRAPDWVARGSPEPLRGRLASLLGRTACSPTEAATRLEAAEVTVRSFDAYVSSNRTCELGMERATGRPYVHLAQVLEQLTR